MMHATTDDKSVSHTSCANMQCDKSKSMFRYNKTIKNTIQKLIALYNRKVKYVPTLVYTRTHDLINYLPARGML